MPTATAKDLVTALSVKVNGQELARSHAAALDKISDVTVEQSLHLPDACTITFHDVGSGQDASDPLHFHLTDQDIMPIGAKIEVEMAAGLGPGVRPKKVFDGEVTAQELDVAYGEAPQLIVHAYDRAHRLQRGRTTRAFKQVTDSDIASKIARESGLRPDVDPTSEVYDWALQNNQTNFELLKERASRIGYEAFVDGDTLHFRKPQVEQQATLGAELWNDALYVRLHMSSAGQVGDVTVRGWDPKQKQAIVGQASQAASTARGGQQKSGSAMARPFGDASMTVLNRPVKGQEEAQKMAQALADELAGNAMYLEAAVHGNPDLRPGQMVDLKSLGDRFSGQYYVTSATHRLGKGGYTTAIVVGGRRSGTMLEMMSGAGANGNGHGVGNAVVIGLVTNNNDSEGGMYRVKLKLPWLEDNTESDWARVATPNAGNGRGFYWLPEVNDEVLVAFEHGDPTRPFVIGALWNGSDKTPGDGVVAEGKVNKRIIKSRSGHTITIDDSQDNSAIKIVDSSEKNSIVIDTKNNKLTLTAQGDMVLQASGDVEISGANVSVKATQDWKVDAKANANMSGANISVSATTGCTVEGKSSATFSGGTVSVEGKATAALKAPLVNIN